MRSQQDSMMVVRAELCERLESLQAHAQRLSTRAFAENVDGIRVLAAAYGLIPVVRLAQALERSLCQSSSAHACPTALYLQRMGDAIGCERLDEQASEAMMASVAIRLGA